MYVLYFFHNQSLQFPKDYPVLVYKVYKHKTTIFVTNAEKKMHFGCSKHISSSDCSKMFLDCIVYVYTFRAIKFIFFELKRIEPNTFYRKIRNCLFLLVGRYATD